MSDELNSIDATEAVERIKRKEINVYDLVQSCLNRIEKVDPVVEAWAFLDPEIAKAQAKKIDSNLAAGVEPGPLIGIPLSGAATAWPIFFFHWQKKALKKP